MQGTNQGILQGAPRSPPGGSSGSVGEMVEGTLPEKLRKLEALHAGTTIAGEREAAQRAAERIRARLAELRGLEQEIEYRYSLPDPWKRKLFLAFCRRYGLSPYREYGQRRSSVMLRAPRTFQDRTLWPHYQAVSEELDAHLDELTTRVIREAIDEERIFAAAGIATTACVRSRATKSPSVILDHASL
jgi:hypothetical protein